jgi:hypothetical protein
MFREIGRAIWLTCAYSRRSATRFYHSAEQYAHSGAARRRWHVALYLHQVEQRP